MAARLSLVLSLALVSLTCSGDSTSAPSSAVRVAEAGWSFGFCLGPCNGTLAIQDEALAYRVTSREGDEVLASSRGRLTPSGRTRLSSLVSSLPEQLRDVYGCPDCADAGAAYVVVVREDSPRRSEYEYPNPPAELAALDAFLKSAMDALGNCESTPDVMQEGDCARVPR